MTIPRLCLVVLAAAIACGRSDARPDRAAPPAAAGTAASAPARLPPDTVVARVDGEPILAAEIEPPGTAPRDAAARARYLDNAITRRLLRREAARLRITGADEAATFAALRAAEVDAKLTVPEDALRAELAAHPDRYPRFPRVHLRQVFVPLASDAPAATVDTAARRLRDRVARAPAAGTDLGLLRYQLGPDAWGDGILADPALREVAAALAPGATSPVLRSARGLHVLTCLAREPAGLATFAEAADRLEPVVRARLRAAAEDSWLASLRARHRVELLDPHGRHAP